MTTTLQISAVNAETSDFIELLKVNGVNEFSFSVLIAAVSGEISGSDLLASIDALAKESSNGPIPVGGPADKAVTGAPGDEALFSKLTDNPRIYKVPGTLSITENGSVDTVGWYVIAVPQEVDDFDISPSYSFVKKVNGAANVPFTFYSKDLTSTAREVLRLRGLAKIFKDGVEAQWGGQSTATWNMVFNYVLNTLWPWQDEKLASMQPDIVWAILDFSLPARDFDLLIANWLQMRAILADVPWPDIPFFQRCAEGVPITVGLQEQPLTVGDYSLYAPSRSAYFPRTDRQIKTDLGMLWLSNLGGIFECVVKKVEEKIADAKKSEKMWHILADVVPLFLFPFPQQILAAITDIASYTFLKNVNPLIAAGFNLALSTLFGLAGGGAAIPGYEFTSKILDKAIEILKQKLASIGLDELKEAAKDADKLKDIMQGTLGLGELPPVLKPFITWCLRVSVLDVFLAGVYSALLEQPVDPQETITQPLIDDATAAGVPVSSSLLALVNGEDSDFPVQQPSHTVAIVAGTVGGAGAIVLGYLAIAGKLW